VGISSTLISNVTEVVEEDCKVADPNLDPVYPIVYLDAIVVKVEQEGKIFNQSIHQALGVVWAKGTLRTVDHTN
jgi:putative transposase